MKKLFSDNIIFFDTEFTHINPSKGELISIGLVKPNGDELYIELDYQGLEIHPWVKRKVLPYLTGKTISREKAREKIWHFIGEHNKKHKPFLMAYVNQFDAIYWYKLFADPKKHPVFWIPIDFASILFAYNFDPESLRKEKFFKMLEINKEKYHQHNALDDARLLKEVYYKFINYLGNL